MKLTDEEVARFIKGSEYLREDQPPKFNWWFAGTMSLVLIFLAIAGVAQ